MKEPKLMTSEWSGRKYWKMDGGSRAIKANRVKMQKQRQGGIRAAYRAKLMHEKKMSGTRTVK